MNKHSKKFFDFIDELHNKNISYVIFRGFEKLPIIPDKDIDMLGSFEKYDEILDIASKYFVKNKKICDHLSYGFAEWCDMKLNPYFTSLEPDKTMPDGNKPGRGFFRIDLQNSLYFKSPYDNFKSYWTVSKKFNDYVFETKRKREHDDLYYYVPSIECDIILLVLRDTLDKKRKWKNKHVNRIKKLLKIANYDELLKCVEMVLPEADKIVDYLYNNELHKINKIIEGI